MTDEPFGRQPEPVRIKLRGSPEDVRYWLREFRLRAEFKGDVASSTTYDSDGHAEFTIYPRAVND